MVYLCHVEIQKPVILFDGVCNYCNSIVNFVIRHDKHNRLLFAPLQSQTGQELLRTYHLPVGDFNSFVFISEQKAWLRSSAALQVLRQLPWYWQWTRAFWIIPQFIRDAVYNLIARNRYRWFGKKETCMIPTPDVKARFLV